MCCLAPHLFNANRYEVATRVPLASSGPEFRELREGRLRPVSMSASLHAYDFRDFDKQIIPHLKSLRPF